jgi:hypothetical protein
MPFIPLLNTKSLVISSLLHQRKICGQLINLDASALHKEIPVPMEMYLDGYGWYSEKVGPFLLEFGTM